MVLVRLGGETLGRHASVAPSNQSCSGHAARGESYDGCRYPTLMARADACSSVMHPAVTAGDPPANLGGRLEERRIVWPSRCHEPHQPSNRDDHHRQANDQLLPRHGWGCEPNPAAAIEYLSAAASNAAEIENLALQAGLKKGGVAKGELVLAIFELANCFRHGWGIPKDAIAAKQVRLLSDQEIIRPS